MAGIVEEADESSKVRARCAACWGADRPGASTDLCLSPAPLQFLKGDKVFALTPGFFNNTQDGEQGGRWHPPPLQRHELCMQAGPGP